MSGEVYEITRRAVNAYINTGSVPQYVAAQVERDVSAMMCRKLREAKAAAWDAGVTAGLSWDENRGEDFKTANPYR